MTEVLVTPDVEAAAVVFLRSSLGALASKVATAVPATMPDTMVRLSLTGGSRQDVASDSAQLTTEVWSVDSPTASHVARRAQAYMMSAAGSAPGVLWVRRSELVGGVQFFPDPDTNKPRYQFTVRWHVRPAAI